MNTAFRKSFERDLKKIKDEDLLARIGAEIEAVEAAANLKAISNLKKMAGTRHFYRIRVGEHRLGIVVEKETVEFVRCLARKDLYREIAS